MCKLWPDVKPSAKFDMTGKRYFKLVYTHVVFKHGPWWYYLADCDCGNECIVRDGAAKSCGCGYSKPPPKPLPPPEPKPKYFERNVVCMKLPFKCARYMECLDEIVFKRKRRPTNYHPGCYVKTKEEDLATGLEQFNPDAYLST